MKLKEVILTITEEDLMDNGYQEGLNRLMDALRSLPEAQCRMIDLTIQDDYSMVRNTQKVVIEFRGEPVDPKSYVVQLNRCPTADRHDPHQGHSWIMNDIAYWCSGYTDPLVALLEETTERPEHTGNLIVGGDKMYFEPVEKGGTDDNVDASPRGSDPEPR